MPISYRLRFVEDRLLSFICSVFLLGTEATESSTDTCRVSQRGRVLLSLPFDEEQLCYYSLCYGTGTNKIDGIFSQIRKHFLRMAESLGSALTLGIRTPSSSSLELLSPETLSQAQWEKLPRQG